MNSKELVVKKDSDWYKGLLEELGAMITEKKFNCAWTLLEMYHEAGTMILGCVKKAPITKLVKEVSDDLHLCERNIWYACQFVQKFPDINALPEGKSMTWSQVKKLLPANNLLEKREPRDIEDIAHAIFLKHGVENCKQIIFYLNKFIKEFNEEDSA
jgi:hypothetical protein